MSYVPHQGGTLLVPSGPRGSHLFVVVTHPCENGFHLLLSLSTIRDGRYYDPACTFSVDEHPFITAPSFVDYAKPEQKGIALLKTCVEKGYYIPKEDFETKLLDRIIDGAEISDRIKPWARKYLFENC